MHEIALCEAVVTTAQQRAAGREVMALGVRVGAMHRVVPDALRQAFELVAPGTVVEGARVEIVTVPLDGTCRGCGARFTSDHPLTACPECASVSVDTRGGDELTLEWLQYRGEER